MPGIDINQLVTVSAIKPGATPDGKQPVANIRGGRYLEQYVQNIVPTKHMLSDEGSYFTANNGQTGQISAATTPSAFVATTPWAIIYNNAPAGVATSPKIYLDYFNFTVSLQGATMTNVQCAVVRDTGNRFSALGAGGVQLTPVKSNSAAQTSNALVYTGGQMTATAASGSAVTIVGNRFFVARAAPASLTGDVYIGQFGSVDNSTMGAFSATVAAPFLQGFPPMVLQPNESALIYLWFQNMATTGVTILPELGWWER